jgi:transcriptional regulator with XRE-family HTH domain
MTKQHTLSELIEARAKALGLSDSAIARKAGIPRSTVQAIRTGQRMPGLDVGRALCRALGIPAAPLLSAAEMQARMAAHGGPRK